MKRYLILFSLLFCSFLSWATTMPAIKGRLRVCAQNCQYYYVLNYATSTMTDYDDLAGLEAKTGKMVSAFLTINADIYALCEVEENDSVLSYLTRAMNDSVGCDRYAFVRDGLGPYESIKGGFVYRRDKVEPYGNNVVGTTENNTAYRMRCRIQAFTELSTGERFVLSVNHFKSKSGDQNGETSTQRVDNANGVIAQLSQYSITRLDPDQLVVGDLNETTSEPAVQRLVNAGYAEQLERFDSRAYSYYYSRQNILLDHILANASMAAQVVDAGVYHINTDNYSGLYKTRYRYSDHDPVICGLQLGQSGTDLEPLYDGLSPELPLSVFDAEQIFSISGQNMTSRRYDLPTGIYILRRGSRVQKVSVR